MRESHVWSYGKRVESENKPAEKATMYGKRVDKHEPVHPPLVPGVDTSTFYGKEYTTPRGLEKFKAFLKKRRMWPESSEKPGPYGSELDKPAQGGRLYLAENAPSSTEAETSVTGMKTTELEKLQKQARQEQTLAGKNEDRMESEAEEA